MKIFFESKNKIILIITIINIIFSKENELIALNGVSELIVLIKGNHDIKNMSSTAEQTLFKFTTQQMLIEVEGRKMYLNHYPFLCYAGVYRDQQGLIFQAYGHVHSGPNKKGKDMPRLAYTFPTQYDVGVDNNNYEPISWHELNEKIQKQLKESND